MMEIKIANFINLNFEKIIIKMYNIILCSHTDSWLRTCFAHIYSCKCIYMNDLFHIINLNQTQKHVGKIKCLGI